LGLLPPVLPLVTSTAAVGNNTEDEKTCCIICMDAKRSMLCDPCGHFALCAACSTGVVRCPVCMTDVIQMKKVFLV
jgi:hypothetical protein